MLPSLLPLLLLPPAILARTGYLPEDPFAFPKFRVTFLNGLPLLNETAERWLREGLHGGEPEFLDQTWETNWETPPPLREIGSGHDRAPDQQATPQAPSSYAVEHMKMGPRDSYLCLIPPSLEQSSTPAEEPQTEVTAMHSWSLLQPLAGSCIYHRQGWFTYAYCHNSHVRQFRELFHPPAAGSYQIEEDPDWEAYDLGRAPEPESGAALTITEQAAQLANLELARGAGSRYLVQRWGDGTVCDKTKKRREIEVQFHCSMTMTDSIMFVKETKTCHYVLVINTPRLCGEPGFKSRLDHTEEALIRCRRVVDATALANADNTLPEADHPFRRQKAPPAPIDAPTQAPPAPKSEEKAPPPDKDDLIRRTLAAILGKANVPAAGGGGGGGGGGSHVVVEDLGDGEMVIDFYGDADVDEEDLELDLNLDDPPDRKALEDALRAAGYDVRPGAFEFRDETHGKDKSGKEKARENKDRGRKEKSKGSGARRTGKAARARRLPTDRDEL